MLRRILASLSSSTRSLASALHTRATVAALAMHSALSSPWSRALLLGAALIGGLLFKPPVRTLMPGEVALRISRLTGDLRLFREGAVLCVPLIHELRRYSLRDQISRLDKAASATSQEPFQSIEGLPIGMRVTARWALDPDRILASARRLPENIGVDLIEPEVDEVLRRSLAKSTVREIFAGKRLELEMAALDEVRARLAPEGIQLKSLSLGSIDLPDEYRKGLQGLLTDELAVDRTKETLALKKSEIEQSLLEARAEKARRETTAEAAAAEEMIAARSHAEAMKHVLPLKQKEIEQRRLEAEARGVEKKRDAQSSAEARLIEAGAESSARKQLAEADAYKIEVTGKVQSEQYERDAAVLTRNPLLVQKAFAEKMGEHLQVVVAPPSMGGFFAANLLGGAAARAAPRERGGSAARGLADAGSADDDEYDNGYDNATDGPVARGDKR